MNVKNNLNSACKNNKIVFLRTRKIMRRELIKDYKNSTQKRKTTKLKYLLSRKKWKRSKKKTVS